MKKSTLIFSCIALMLTGCGDVSNKASSTIAEKTIEAISGNKIDAADVSNVDKNSTVVDVVLDGKNIKSDFKNSFGSITASKETIAITIAQVDGGQDNILLGFNGNGLSKLRPIKGKMVKGEKDGFTFSIMKVTDNAMDVQLSFEAEGEIVSLQKEKIVIKVKGKTGSSADAENPEKWKSYEGTITLNYPVFQALQSSKEDFIY